MARDRVACAIVMRRSATLSRLLVVVPLADVAAMGVQASATTIHGSCRLACLVGLCPSGKVAFPVLVKSLGDCGDSDYPVHTVGH